MSNTAKKIIAWIAGALLAAGVIGTTTYKVMTGEATVKDTMKQVANSVQQYTSDTVSDIMKKDTKEAEVKTDAKAETTNTEVKKEEAKATETLAAKPAAKSTAKPVVKK